MMLRGIGITLFAVVLVACATTLPHRLPRRPSWALGGRGLGPLRLRRRYA
jgi:hypothetical protein